MRVLVTGATGFIGQPLCRALQAHGHRVLALSRDPAAAGRKLPPGVEPRAAPTDAAGWDAALVAVDGVVNLAGESIAGRRWSPTQKARIRDSRVLGTRALVEAIGRADSPPRVLVNSSGVGYYGPRGAEPVDESDAPGSDFLAEVCRDWESEAQRAAAGGTRVVLVRTGVVLGRGGGALAKLLPPFKLFAGGPFGDGRQGFPWIHLDDVVGIYVWALEHDEVAGPLNAAGPEPLDNRTFSAALGRALDRPSWAPVPGFALKLLLGEMAEPLLLRGQKVLPRRTQELGYHFTYPTLAAALADLV